MDLPVELLRQALRSGADRLLRLIRFPIHIDKNNTILQRNNQMRNRNSKFAPLKINPLFTLKNYCVSCQDARLSAFNIAS